MGPATAVGDGESDRVPVVVTYAIGDNDVVLGRGAPVIALSGNVQYRRLISSRKTEYMGTSRQQHKHAIAMEVIEEINRRGGRFLRKVGSEDDGEEERLGVPKGVSAWVAVDMEAALKKVKQALREFDRKSRAVSKSDDQQDVTSINPQRQVLSSHASAPASYGDTVPSAQLDRLGLQAAQGYRHDHRHQQLQNFDQARRLAMLQHSHVLPIPQRSLNPIEATPPYYLEQATSRFHGPLAAMGDVSAQATPWFRNSDAPSSRGQAVAGESHGLAAMDVATMEYIRQQLLLNELLSNQRSRVGPRPLLPYSTSMPTSSISSRAVVGQSAAEAVESASLRPFSSQGYGEFLAPSASSGPLDRNGNTRLEGDHTDLRDSKKPRLL